MHDSLINIAYLFAACLFIFGLKGLTHPRTAVRGNFYGALGMFIAVVATLLKLTGEGQFSYTWIIAGVAIGGLIGVLLAWRIQMTAMPQLVALFNGFGGIASLLVAGAALVEELGVADSEIVTGAGTAIRSVEATQFTVATAGAGLIGAVTFVGSVVAFIKLQELVPWKVMKKLEAIPGTQFLNILLVLGALALSGYVVFEPANTNFYWGVVAVASVLGIFLVLPIGGADMPVVIALLNSYSGLAAAATGFVLNNNVLIIAGSLVGASGLILTSIMCKAMNRSLANVLFGGALSSQGGGVQDADAVYAGKVKSTSADEVAMLLGTAQRVIFVPGYGMAVAQAQHAVRDLTNLLESNNTEVEFAIHPVAGRMPGHMNVLLAEADIAYDKLKELDIINPTFEQADVAVVIGANDVVNPVAREDPNSPIAGMPILNVDKARTVVVIKRSLSPGFAGIPNPLFAADNTLMFFGDGKKAVSELITAFKEMQ